MSLRLGALAGALVLFLAVAGCDNHQGATGQGKDTKGAQDPKITLTGQGARLKAGGREYELSEGVSKPKLNFRPPFPDDATLAGEAPGIRETALFLSAPLTGPIARMGVVYAEKLQKEGFTEKNRFTTDVVYHGEFEKESGESFSVYAIAEKELGRFTLIIPHATE